MKYSSCAVHRRASTRQRCRSGAAPTDRIGPREHLRQPAASPLVRAWYGGCWASSLRKQAGKHREIRASRAEAGQGGATSTNGELRGKRAARFEFFGGTETVSRKINRCTNTSKKISVPNSKFVSSFEDQLPSGSRL